MSFETLEHVARPDLFLREVARVLAPGVWLARSSTEGLLRLFGLARDRKMTVTEDEVRSLVAEGTRAGVFMPKEREMIEGVLRLADRTARAIMTPGSTLSTLQYHVASMRYVVIPTGKPSISSTRRSCSSGRNESAILEDSSRRARGDQLSPVTPAVVGGSTR